MSRILKGILFATVPVLFLTLLLVAVETSKTEEKEHEREAAKPQPSVSVQDGQTVITLEPDTQARLGLRVTPMAASTRRAEQRMPGFVLPVQDLAGSKNDYAAAIAKLDKTKANLEVSQREYDRLKGLYNDNQNASAKTFQAAEGTLRSDEADMRAAEQAVHLQENVVRQLWGPAVEEWFRGSSSHLNNILEQREFLVQITLPSGTASSVPGEIGLELPGANTVSAVLVSPFPRIDPRIQGTSYLYSASGKPGMTPGMNLVARMTHGVAREGVIVPESAAVWWEGRAWIYRQTGATTFARQEISTGDPVSGGWFVTSALSPGDKVVTTGGESLLSTELGSQASGEQGEETE